MGWTSEPFRYVHSQDDKQQLSGNCLSRFPFLIPYACPAKPYMYVCGGRGSGVIAVSWKDLEAFRYLRCMASISTSMNTTKLLPMQKEAHGYRICVYSITDQHPFSFYGMFCIKYISINILSVQASLASVHIYLFETFWNKIVFTFTIKTKIEIQ